MAVVANARSGINFSIILTLFNTNFKLLVNLVNFCGCYSENFLVLSPKEKALKLDKVI
jgi:hypothetical protein